MFSYPTRSGVNILKDFNLEVKVGDNVAVMYAISETSKAKLLITILP
jgi:predicted ABC-type transport system involved in lysophospholipase L1 biosynthesis ATPase subunit